MADQRGRRDGAAGKPTGRGSGKPAGARGGKPASSRGDKPAGARGTSGGSKPAARGGKPGGRDGDRSQRSYSKDGDRPKRSYGKDDDRPKRSYGKDDDRPKRSYGKDGAGSGGGRGAGRDGGSRASRDPDAPRSAEQERYDGPPLPDDVTGAELSASVRAHLKGLPEKLAARVARHLAAAGQMVDDDPETAYQHTLAAKARAPRIAVVREAVGESAYAAGHYAEALAELRAAKRMNGATAYLPIMADCHRALGNPTRALELAKSPAVARFAPAAKAEMTIVEAGARADLGQYDAALRTLEVAPINSQNREAWMVRLRYAYADTLEQAGRLNDALKWFHKTNAIDADEFTDAADRAESLEKRVER